MDELKPGLREAWEYLRQNPHLALSGALFLGGIMGLAFGVPQIAGALFGAGAALLGGWITLTNTQRASAAQKARDQADAKRYLTPELKRVIDRLLHIHQRTLANYSTVHFDQIQPSDILVDFLPQMPVLYPNAPQFHDLAAENAMALIELYDSLNILEKLVEDWYDRPATPTQPRVNVFNAILATVDEGLRTAQVCVTRFEIDVLYPPRNGAVGTTSQRIERAFAQTENARNVFIERFNAQQAEERAGRR